MSEIARGAIVRATDWPATHGKRFRVVRVSEDGYAQVREIGGGAKMRMIEVHHLRVDETATRASPAH